MRRPELGERSRGAWTRARPALAAVALALLASGATRRGLVVTPSATGSVVVEGDSTLHTYAARTRDLRVSIEANDDASDASALSRLLRPGGIASAELELPVKSLSSGDARLDQNMAKALKADSFPTIRFVARSFEIEPLAGGSFGVTMHGRLTLAGVERVVDVRAAVSRAPGGLRLVGRRDLLMTDFGIAPPRLMLGALKVANAVTVRFDLALRTGAP